MMDEKKYKFSRYNVRYKWNERDYIWNTLTDALIELDKEDADYIDNTSDPESSSVYFEPLFKNGFILPNKYDELGKILYEEKAAMLEQEPAIMQYTIAPGLGCNYDCVYCFEKTHRHSQEMNLKTQESVCNYIINAADHNPKIKEIRVTWFGGEPLLYQGVICNISRRLIEYCQNNSINYQAGIVTNGRYLNKDTAEMLKKLHVKHVQLSFDGMKEVYIQQKRCSEKDFDYTIRNIQDCADIIPITIRINIDKNLDNANLLTEYLLSHLNLDEKIKIYIAHIRDYACEDSLTERNSHDAFLKLQGLYMKQFTGPGKYSLDSFCYIPPKRRFTTCATVCRNNFCIGPEGELYRCEHFFGNQEQIIGTVQNGLYNNWQDLRFLFFTHHKACMECNMFPICLGGCMNDAVDGDISLSCEALKSRWIELLMLHYETKKEVPI